MVELFHITCSDSYICGLTGFGNKYYVPKLKSKKGGVIKIYFVCTTIVKCGVVMN